MVLSRERYLETLEREGETLAAAARGRLSLPVPTCPGWTVGDLLDHTGGVYRFWTQIATGMTDRSMVVREPGPAPEVVVEWFEEGLARLTETLRSADPDTPIWTWAPVEDPTVSWIIRRMAHETCVHRWDAQNAVGSPNSIESEFAADGIDELLFVFLPAWPELHRGDGTTAHVHSTDAEGEWFVRMDDGNFTVTREHKKGDVALRAPAGDVLLALWERIPLTDLEVLGDESAAKTLIAGIDRT